MDSYYNTFGQKINYNTYDLKSSDPLAIGSIYDIKHLSNSVIPALKQRFDQPQMKTRIFRTDSIRKVNLKNWLMEVLPLLPELMPEISEHNMHHLFKMN